MKTCPKCNQTKPLSEFYKNCATKDGYLNDCKICCSKYQKKYIQTKQGKVAHKRYKQSEKGKAVCRIADKRFRIRHPNYVKAHNTVKHAIKVGKLPRSDSLLCHYCPAQAEQYHHWRDYEPEHQLDVVPVCRKCHRKIHRKIA